jgi:hypothetical protein
MTAQLRAEPTLLTHYFHLHPPMSFLTYLKMLELGYVNYVH